VGRHPANRLSSMSWRCSSWPRGAGNAWMLTPEEPHVRPHPPPRAPPRLKPTTAPPTNPPPVWAHLPADRQKQLHEDGRPPPTRAKRSAGFDAPWGSGSCNGPGAFGAAVSWLTAAGFVAGPRGGAPTARAAAAPSRVTGARMNNL